MRMFWPLFILSLAVPSARAEPADEHVRKLFSSHYYTVTWGDAPTWPADAELEIGDGDGHGGTLGWLRFRPDQDGIDVLSIRLDEGWGPPPDHALVQVKRARMTMDGYAGLLHSLAAVDAARLTPAKGLVGPGFWSSRNFWAYARLTANGATLQDLNWSGYPSGRNETKYAKAVASVSVARGAAKGLDFAKHELTVEDRRWASAKFSRDMKKFHEIESVKGMELSHWWVRERYTIAIGIVGDASALPALREILLNPERPVLDAIDPEGMKKAADRRVYHAINAITRLTRKDVRPQPIEEMDVEAARRKVLELMPADK